MRVRRAVEIAGALVALLGVAMGLLWAMQRSIIYQPDTAKPPPASTVIPGATDVELRTEDGLTLDAWLVPATTVTDRDVAVLYAPGNGGNRAGRAGIARLLAERGFTVLLMDYRGFGGNPGSPSESGTALDARAAADFLISLGYPRQHLIYFGESLGTGVVAELLTRTPPAGVVLRSPFTELADVAADHVGWLPVRWLLRDNYEVTAKLRGTDVPVTVIYGSSDTIVRPAFSRRVAEGIPHLHEEMVLAADHNDPRMFGPAVAAAVARLAEATTT